MTKGRCVACGERLVADSENAKYIVCSRATSDETKDGRRHPAWHDACVARLLIGRAEKGVPSTILTCPAETCEDGNLCPTVTTLSKSFYRGAPPKTLDGGRYLATECAFANLLHVQRRVVGPTCAIVFFAAVACRFAMGTMVATLAIAAIVVGFFTIRPLSFSVKGRGLGVRITKYEKMVGKLGLELSAWLCLTAATVGRGSVLAFAFRLVGLASLILALRHVYIAAAGLHKTFFATRGCGKLRVPRASTWARREFWRAMVIENRRVTSSP